MSRAYDVVDADGHVLEPADLWTKNIAAKFRDEAPRLIVDTDGKERLLVAGKPMGHPVVGLARLGGVGVPINEIIRRGWKYSNQDGEKGGFDPHARIKALDLDGIDAAVLYPTLGLSSGAIQDPDLAAAVCRTYNEWIADYCRPYPDRLFAVAMLPMQSVEHAVEEIRYARNTLGMHAGFLRLNPYNNRLLCDEAYNPLWAEAQELDFSISFHEGTVGGMPAVAADRVRGHPARHIASHTMEMMLACLNVIWGGVCERFPKVRFGFLECGGGWMVPWLDRMDRHHGKGTFDEEILKLTPSEYFERQCWIAFEPVEKTIASSAGFLGANKIMWATDYPHADGFFPGAPKMVADQLPQEIRRQVMAQGAVDFYKLN